jgi:hypothetical protein
MDLPISSGQPTRNGPPTEGSGEVRTTPNHKNLTCYESKHKTSDVVNKRWSSSLGLGEVFTTSYHKNLLHNKAQDLELHQICWDNVRNRKWAYNLLEVLSEGLDWIDLAQYSEIGGKL